MNAKNIAPCGLNCELCLGFQRKKNTCAGCNADGFKPTYCQTCSIRMCAEKMGNPEELCSACPKFPCRRLRDLNKRYSLKYGESNFDNFIAIAEIGLEAFALQEEIKWACPSCGAILCVHKPLCRNCGAKNTLFPER